MERYCFELSGPGHYNIYDRKRGTLPEQRIAVACKADDAQQIVDALNFMLAVHSTPAEGIFDA